MSETAARAGIIQRIGRRIWVIASLLGLLVVGLVLHVTGALGGLTDRVFRIPERPSEALSGVVDVFACCIFTWEIFPIVLPAFLLGGAVAAFVPTAVILKYLGAGAKRSRSYGVAATSGALLSLCSCNIVPLFVSVYRRGAGIGPAFTLLYAGPAINIVAIFFTISVIDVTTGVWRALCVPIIALLTGSLMALLFRREASQRAEEARINASAAG
ncbi:MAG: hypothetical protein GF320_20195, partial [Armatimonadia bacterium]|nr:hypothetical protein [Armatimonadia bacterium]